MATEPIEPAAGLDNLTAWMRRNGVLHYQHNGIVLTLSPEVIERTVVEAFKAQVAKSQPRDKIFGLTQDEQEDLFQQVVADPNVVIPEE